MVKKPFIALALLLLGASGVQAASGEWGITLSVSTPYSAAPGGTVTNTLSAGVRNGASDGYDNAMDTVSFLEPDDPIQTHFPHGAQMQDTDGDGVLDGWDCLEPETGYNAFQCSLWRDFRGPNESGVWTFEIVSPVNGASVSLNWRIDGEPEDLANVELTLVDLSAVPPLPPLKLDRTSGHSYTTAFSTTSGRKYDVRRFEIRMKTTAPMIAPPALPPGTLNSPYSQALRIIGGGGMWSLAGGGLPPGLRLDPSSGQIEGTPLQEGTYPFTVRADDPLRGMSVSRDYSLTILPPLVITTPDLSGGAVDSPYAGSFSASGGTPPLLWGLSSGDLPEGVSLDKNSGTLSGTLQVPGLFEFTIQVEDALQARDARTYRIAVTEPSDQNPPSAVTDLRALMTMGTSTILSWTAPSDDSITRTASAYDLRYSKSCPPGGDAAAWWEEALHANGEPRPQPGTLHTYTLSGLEAGRNYCAAVRSLDASGHLSDLSNVIAFPDGASGGGGTASGPVTLGILLQKGYNLISAPLFPLPNDLSAFQDDVGSDAALYRWYSAYPGLTPAQWYSEGGIQPGYGYFLYAPETGITLDITGLPVSDPQVAIPLQGGWNLVGNPYPSDVLLKDVRIREVRESGDGETRMFEGAASAGWVGNALYAFTGLGYEFVAVNDDPPAPLKPWVGFWMYAQEGKTLEMIFGKPTP